MQHNHGANMCKAESRGAHRHRRSAGRTIVVDINLAAVGALLDDAVLDGAVCRQASEQLAKGKAKGKAQGAQCCSALTVHCLWEQAQHFASKAAFMQVPSQLILTLADSSL